MSNDNKNTNTQSTQSNSNQSNSNNAQVASVTENNKNTSGQLTFDDKVLKKIIGIALAEVDGLLDVDGGFFSNLAGKIVNSNDPTKGIEVEVGKEQIAVDMKAIVEYGRNIQAIYENMQKVITDQVKKMTGLDLVELNVDVVDIQSAEEFEKKSETIQDKVNDAKDSASDKANNAKNKVSDKASDVKDKASDAKGKVQDTVDNATKESSRVK
ncbi:Asp23/Gls24 family envelope stress response protein [Floricoccus penangensis]|uniref:Asp23/Gls24 family envelope stress response protein n=1 Tax=Floricoccus penangensis TaxID=1859475 RepID=UPI00204265A7|nr:Asp23/Gls24 family envelope stress response protein [Floricoccus penangensis]URZ88281.1 Asp23/Gls24 family envelope stress response protein [Floricoccus penangensis]